MDGGSSRNALVSKYASKLPFIVLLDHLSVVLHLQLVAAGLVVLLSADPAVGADAELRFFALFDEVTLGGDDLHFLLGAVEIHIPDAVLRGLPLVICAAPLPDRYFLCDSHAVGSPPLCRMIRRGGDVPLPQRQGDGAIPLSLILVIFTTQLNGKRTKK